MAQPKYPAKRRFLLVPADRKSMPPAEKKAVTDDMASAIKRRLGVKPIGSLGRTPRSGRAEAKVVVMRAGLEP